LEKRLQQIINQTKTVNCLFAHTNTQTKGISTVIELYIQNCANFWFNNWVQWLSRSQLMAKNSYPESICCLEFFVQFEWYSRIIFHQHVIENHQIIRKVNTQHVFQNMKQLFSELGVVIYSTHCVHMEQMNKSCKVRCEFKVENIIWLVWSNVETSKVDRKFNWIYIRLYMSGVQGSGF
jgi:hypothetical protein